MTNPLSNAVTIQTATNALQGAVTGPTGVTPTLTVFVTVISGVLVFVIGQVVLKVLIEPVQEIRKLIGEIAHSLAYHANHLYTPGAEQTTAKQVYREQACTLRGLLETVPALGYPLARALFLLPSKKNLARATSELMGLSNVTDRAGNADGRRENIEKLLGLRTY